jgi:hypothetical protein
VDRQTLSDHEDPGLAAVDHHQEGGLREVYSEVRHNGEPSLWPGVSAGINLHLHDLRREAGSRLLDAGVPLSVIQASLDHAKISTSSRPLKVTQHEQHVALKPDEETRPRDTNVAHGRRRSPTNRFQVSLSNNGI